MGLVLQAVPRDQLDAAVDKACHLKFTLHRPSRPFCLTALRFPWSACRLRDCVASAAYLLLRRLWCILAPAPAPPCSFCADCASALVFGCAQLAQRMASVPSNQLWYQKTVVNQVHCFRFAAVVWPAGCWQTLVARWCSPCVRRARCLLRS